MDSTPRVVPAEIDWSDELWEELWERNFSQVERHAIAVDVWRQQVPQTNRLWAAVGIELARRWRRRARNLGIVYGLWTLLWAAIALNGLGMEAGADGGRLPWVLAGVGVVAVAACGAVRVRLRTVARA